MRYLCVGMLIVIVAGCSAPNSGVVPNGATPSRRGFADTRGTVTLYREAFAGSFPAGITSGPDGALWVTDTETNVIGRITTAGKFTLEQRLTVALSDGITTGPDKNLWFTVAQLDAYIGRITPAGKVTLFKDSGGFYPQGITTGPDGALWFAESNGRIGRMTTSGSVKHFRLEGNGAELKGIVTGPDRNLWVTQYTLGSSFSNHVFRVTTSGSSTAYNVGNGPDFICVGPDNALWFTETGANALGRLTTAGSYSQFPSKYQYAEPSGIASGPDDALWFTDFSGHNGIGRMTTTGSVEHYRVPGPLPEIEEITSGSDGEMWFTSFLGPSAVGRITTH